MRITIPLDDGLVRELEAQATREGRTIGEIIEDALRTHRAHRNADRPIDPLPVYGGTGVLPGIDLGDAASLRDVVDVGDLLAPRAGGST